MPEPKRARTGSGVDKGETQVQHVEDSQVTDPKLYTPSPKEAPPIDPFVDALMKMQGVEGGEEEGKTDDEVVSPSKDQVDVSVEVKGARGKVALSSAKSDDPKEAEKIPRGPSPKSRISRKQSVEGPSEPLLEVKESDDEKKPGGRGTFQH